MDSNSYDNYNNIHISKKWENYNSKVLKVNPYIESISNKIDFRNLKTLLDLGCGPGNESNYFIEKGFDVTAVDYNNDCLKIISERFPNLENKKFKFILSRIESFEWQKFDAVLSIKVLSFLERDQLFDTFENICKNLNENGIFIARIFGPKDDWKKETLISKEEIENSFQGFDFLYFNEKILQTTTVMNTKKQNHIIDFVV